MSNAFADFNQSLKEVYDAYFVPYDAFRKWSVNVWLVFEAYLGGFGRCLGAFRIWFGTSLRDVWEVLGCILEVLGGE